MCLGRILGVNEEAQGQGRVCKDKHVKKQWSGSKAFRVTEKQSSDDFLYLTSLFQCCQADSWTDITLSSTAVSHELRYLQPLEDGWRVLRIKTGCSFVCSNNALYTGLINSSLLLIFLHQSSAPHVANWSATLSPGEKNIAIISIQFLFQVCGYNSWRLEQVTVGESLELKTAWPSALGTAALQQQNVSAFCIRAVWTVQIKPFFPSNS